MIFREGAPVAPLLAYAIVVSAGVDAREILVPFLLAEAGGVVLYVTEIRHRFHNRNGRR